MERGLCERFAEIRQEKSPNKQHFAEFLEIPSTTVSDIELGKREPSKDVLLKLTSKCGVNLHWMLTGNGVKYINNVISGSETVPSKAGESYKVPLLRQKVSCGSGADWEDEDIIEKYVDIFAMIPRLSAGRLFALPVVGSSMLGAGIQDGDYVLFNARTGQDLRDGNYVFALDGDVFCKRLEFDRFSEKSNKIKIYSVREAELKKAELLDTLTEKEAHERLHIFGRVHCTIKQME